MMDVQKSTAEVCFDDVEDERLWPLAASFDADLAYARETRNDGETDEASGNGRSRYLEALELQRQACGDASLREALFYNSLMWKFDISGEKDTEFTDEEVAGMCDVIIDDMQLTDDSRKLFAMTKALRSAMRWFPGVSSSVKLTDFEEKVFTLPEPVAEEAVYVFAWARDERFRPALTSLPLRFPRNEQLKRSAASALAAWDAVASYDPHVV